MMNRGSRDPQSGGQQQQQQPPLSAQDQQTTGLHHPGFQAQLDGTPAYMGHNMQASFQPFPRQGPPQTGGVARQVGASGDHPNVQMGSKVPQGMIDAASRQHHIMAIQQQQQAKMHQMAMQQQRRSESMSGEIASMQPPVKMHNPGVLMTGRPITTDQFGQPSNGNTRNSNMLMQQQIYNSIPTRTAPQQSAQSSGSGTPGNVMYPQQYAPQQAPSFVGGVPPTNAGNSVVPETNISDKPASRMAINSSKNPQPDYAGRMSTGRPPSSSHERFVMVGHESTVGAPPPSTSGMSDHSSRGNSCDDIYVVEDHSSGNVPESGTPSVNAQRTAAAHSGSSPAVMLMHNPMVPRAQPGQSTPAKANIPMQQAQNMGGPPAMRGLIPAGMTGGGHVHLAAIPLPQQQHAMQQSFPTQQQRVSNQGVATRMPPSIQDQNSAGPILYAQSIMKPKMESQQNPDVQINRREAIHGTAMHTRQLIEDAGHKMPSPAEMAAAAFWNTPLSSRLVAGMCLLENDAALSVGSGLGGSSELWRMMQTYPSPAFCGALDQSTRGMDWRFSSGMVSYPDGRLQSSTSNQEFLFTECSLFGRIEESETPGAVSEVLKLLKSISDFEVKCVWKEECYRGMENKEESAKLSSSSSTAAKEVWIRRYLLPEHLRNVFAVRVYSPQHLAGGADLPVNSRRINEVTCSPQVVALLSAMGYSRSSPNDDFCKCVLFNIDPGTSQHLVVAVTKHFTDRYMTHEVFPGVLFVEAKVRVIRDSFMRRAAELLTTFASRLKPFVHLMKV